MLNEPFCEENQADETKNRVDYLLVKKLDENVEVCVTYMQCKERRYKEMFIIP